MHNPVKSLDIGAVINRLMSKEPQKSIAFDNNIGYQTVSLIKAHWPLFCGLSRHNKADDDDS